MPRTAGVCAYAPVPMSVRREKSHMQALPCPLLQAGNERADAGSDAVCRAADVVLSSSRGAPAFMEGIHAYLPFHAQSVEVIQENGDTFERLLLFTLNFDSKLDFGLCHPAQVCQ